ncbi:hypothetical protein LTS18_004966, partial [Coniosporium uncinatum]
MEDYHSQPVFPEDTAFALEYYDVIMPSSEFLDGIPFLKPPSPTVGHPVTVAVNDEWETDSETPECVDEFRVSCTGVLVRTSDKTTLSSDQPPHMPCQLPPQSSTKRRRDQRDENERPADAVKRTLVQHPEAPLILSNGTESALVARSDVPQRPAKRAKTAAVDKEDVGSDFDASQSLPARTRGRPSKERLARERKRIAWLDEKRKLRLTTAEDAEFVELVRQRDAPPKGVKLGEKNLPIQSKGSSKLVDDGDAAKDEARQEEREDGALAEMLDGDCQTLHLHDAEDGVGQQKLEGTAAELLPGNLIAKPGGTDSYEPIVFPGEGSDSRKSPPENVRIAPESAPTSLHQGLVHLNDRLPGPGQPSARLRADSMDPLPQTRSDRLSLRLPSSPPSLVRKLTSSSELSEVARDTTLEAAIPLAPLTRQALP